jgi:hypothetical protein
LVTQKDGNPTHGIHRQAVLMMSFRASGAVSARALASPFVTSDPLLLIATRR